MAKQTPPDALELYRAAPGNPLMPDTSSYIDLRQLGATGLKQFGDGFIHEEHLRELQGKRAVEAYKEMGDNDAVCGVILYTIDKLLRQVSWRVAPASEAAYDQEVADFIDSCRGDLDESWSDFLSEAFIGMLRYGYSLHEIVYKRRAGDASEPHLKSKYADGRIGWRCLAGRSQDTIYRWLFDDNGRLQGAEQQAPPHYRLVKLPLDKCLLFRTSVEKGNPEGRSIFRTSWRSYWIKRGIENIEAVGVERDVTGLPVAWVPRELIERAEEGDHRAAAMLARFETMATQIRRDASEGIVMPLEYDESNNKRFDLTLLPSGGSRQFDTDKIIQRYDQRIAMGVLADFLLLGQGATAQGSWAMHSDKTKLFLQSITAFLHIFVEQFNSKAIPALLKYNNFEMSDYPRLEFGSLDQVDITALGDLLTKCAAAGMPLFPDDELEAYIRKAANWPEKTVESADVSEVLPQPMEDNASMPELIGDFQDSALIGQQEPNTGEVVTNARPRPVPVTNVGP
jgi:hypothetical protein